MATDEGYANDSLSTGSYSQLLFSEDANLGNLDSVQSVNFYSPQMLCFGESRALYDFHLVQNSSTVDAIKDTTKLSNPNKRRNGSLVKESQMKQNTGFGVRDGDLGNQKNGKKTKAENSTLLCHAKTQVKKEKLGQRITALQQIVSPFGKTDTASVLHEATGYIRFLHDQLQVLSSPYLRRLPTSAHLSEGDENLENKVGRGLRSRGLCLIPVELLITSHFAESNGADFWSPAMVENVSSTSQ